MDTPFPQYKKGVPRFGLDDFKDVMLAMLMAAIPYFILDLMLGDWNFKALITFPAAFGMFRYVAVPLLRHLGQRLPPNFMALWFRHLRFQGGLLPRPDSDPLPFRVR
jgi:hypothetical protein